MTEAYYPIHLTNRLAIQVQGVEATYHPRGWVTRIAIRDCPCEFTLVFDGVKVAKSKDGEIQMKQLDERCRKGTWTARLKKALPYNVRKLVVNMNRIKSVTFIFDKPPPLQNYDVIQSWIQLLTKQCEPYYGNIFNCQFVTKQAVKSDKPVDPKKPYDQHDTILEKQKDFADFYGTDDFRLPPVRF